MNERFSAELLMCPSWRPNDNPVAYWSLMPINYYTIKIGFSTTHLLVTPQIVHRWHFLKKCNFCMESLCSYFAICVASFSRQWLECDWAALSPWLRYTITIGITDFATFWSGPCGWEEKRRIPPRARPVTSLSPLLLLPIDLSWPCS